MYIVFEGIEGSGKSVQIKNVEKFFKKNNLTYHLTKEPGSTVIGKEIRKILLNSSFSEMSYLTEILLYFADRAEHFEKVVEKFIKDVDVLLSDRSMYSTVVYQGFGRGIDMKLLNMLNKTVTRGLVPDYVFLFDCDVETGLNRALKREESKQTDETRFEKEAVEFHKKIRAGYLKLAEKQSNWIIINGNKSINEVRENVIANLKRIMLESGLLSNPPIFYEEKF